MEKTVAYAKIDTKNQSEAMIYIKSFLVSYQTLGLKPDMKDLVEELKADNLQPTKEELEYAEKEIAKMKEDKNIVDAIKEKLGF